VNISVAHLQPIVSLIAGVLILMMPRLFNYIVAFFLIVSGVPGLGLIHYGWSQAKNSRPRTTRGVERRCAKGQPVVIESKGGAS